MAYSINPNLPKARAIALQLLVREDLPLQVVTNRCGVHRSTIWRWKRKWLKINQNVELSNRYRPSRTPGTQFRFTACTWRIPTLSSQPKSSPKAIAQEVVSRVMELRAQLKRCAEVVLASSSSRQWRSD